MRVVVVGYGVQGRKRFAVAGRDAVAIVDPVAQEAAFKDITEVPLDRYDAAIVSTPDRAKTGILRHLLGNGKHVLVEKPLLVGAEEGTCALEALARKNGAVCYTAYNHRFEPHFLRMRALVQSGALGRLYRCRMFYGNGTARLVRESAWRDTGAGVLPDLGSHLLDTARFWFGEIGDAFRVVSARCFENRAPDHVVIASDESRPQLELEITLLSWRNHFSCDLLGENGSAHISSLCKWGPSTLTYRKRVLPAGRPAEEVETQAEGDPTWAAEFAHFAKLCAARVPADLSNDAWLDRVLKRLAGEALAAAR